MNATIHAFAVSRRIEIDDTLLPVGNGIFVSYGAPAVLAPLYEQRYEDNFVYGDNRKEGHVFDLGNTLSESLNSFSFAKAFGGNAENDKYLARFVQNGDCDGAPHFAEMK